MKNGQLLTALVAILVLVPVTQGVAQDVLHARVSYEGGGAMVRGTADDEWSYASVNSLILPGDTVWVDERGTLELEMSGGSFVRLADGSKAEIVQVPPSAVVRGWTGSFYIQRIRRSTGEFAFSTPACSVDIDRDSMVRVDILGEGATTVSVRWGKATVRTEMGRPTILLKGRRVYVDPGYLPSTPRYFDRTEEDAFDTWNRERGKLLAVGPDPMPTSVRYSSAPIGVYDLAPYGEWVYVERVPYWRPTVVVDYIPYRSGHWSHVAGCGYVWVGSYPFSYVTSHYGRWRHHPSHGWIWTYRDTWGPAWCATVRYGPDFVWCPLDPFDRPCTWGTTHFDVGGVHFSVTASSYCSASDLFVGPAVVYPCRPTIVHQTVSVNDIYIWNIGVGGRPHFSLPHRGSGIRARDYAPRRSIRGPETAGPRGHSARARVATLESGAGRDAFRTVSVTGSRSIRTSVSASSRSATVRTARVDPETVLNTRSVVQRAQRSAGAVGLRVSGEQSSGRTRTTRDAAAATSRARTSPTSVARPVGPGTTRPNRETVTDERDGRLTRTPRDAAVRSQPPEAGTRTRTVRDAADETRGNRPPVTRPTPTTTHRDRVDRTSPPQTTRPPSTTTPGPTGRVVRIGDGGSRGSDQSPRRDSVSTSPRATTRGRVHDVSPPQTRTPSVIVPRRSTAPRVTRTPDRSPPVTNSRPPQSVPAPTRPSPRPMPTTRSVSPPSSFSAPTRSVAPRPSFTAPPRPVAPPTPSVRAPAPAPRVSAPPSAVSRPPTISPNRSPSINRSAPPSSRGMTRPTRRR